MSSFTKLLTMRSALVASVLFLAAHVPTTAAYDEVYNGCYSSSTPLEDQGSYTYQSNGYCQKLCLKDNYAVFALHNKQDCLCGNELPASSDKVSDDECNLSCAGWPSVMCGGANTYSVYLTGIEDDVDNYSSSSSTSSKSTEGTSTSTTQTPTVHAVTSGGQTVYVTEAPATHSANASATPTEKSKSSSANTAAIAAGVVIGVVGLCALIGAGFFLWRFKNRKSVEAQYRRSVGVDGYGQPMAQGSDSRFDGDFMAQKRQSNGSIDDDQDFSRRILQVTNPDRR
ncbi:putative WSC domain protein [Aspergillus japonicus CBS 114.51]|uniref:Putative WSC domain protein n=2 Tax=Aspergillus TaxID=5052 RepID=A0A2V5GWL2_ASPV1|nr:putative WSC domain protein [Aspergillus japonicus CBS 114.51]PYI15725.1 putative WSC domain protein [Aspergillus violaceofuscus CBS 115571]RAH76111.1 putative WSC domain protein [Aspergillus japonicus CBS 114.51]